MKTPGGGAGSPEDDSLGLVPPSEHEIHSGSEVERMRLERSGTAIVRGGGVTVGTLLVSGGARVIGVLEGLVRVDDEEIRGRESSIRLVLAEASLEDGEELVVGRVHGHLRVRWVDEVRKLARGHGAGHGLG
jgi:hypothetical protein